MLAKTTVYIPEDAKRSLKELARRLSRSEASLIREAISEFTRTHSVRPRSRSLGFAKGPGNLSGRVDELLAQGFGRDDDADR